jgi:hypothetical protein
MFTESFSITLGLQRLQKVDSARKLRGMWRSNGIVTITTRHIHAVTPFRGYEFEQAVRWRISKKTLMPKYK